MQKKLFEIKNEAKELGTKTDEELNEKIEKLKKRIEIGLEKPETRISEWFALVQEISSRTIGLRHFDTQLLAGLYLQRGKVVEMKTGEGKTLVSTLPASLNALSKKGTHIVTVNDYLAERDQKLMGKIYNKLGLSVGLIKPNLSKLQKQKNYKADITYVTNSELVFDYLRDSTVFSSKEKVQRDLVYCLIDEIDSILIDEARTPLIISESENNNNRKKLSLTKKLISNLEFGIDFEIDEKRKEAFLTNLGYFKLHKKLGLKSLFGKQSGRDDSWILEITNALKAKYILKKDKDYMVLNQQIVIVDEFTGRFMKDRRWGNGLHEAIEMKESVPFSGGSKTKISITYQNFFKNYQKLSGMTGTAKTAEKEFKEIYNLDVVVLPTIKPLLRKDLEDFIFLNKGAKFKAILEKTKECFQKGQPILIGTTTIENSEIISDLLRVNQIPHQLLNAKPENVKRESEIIAEAGSRYSVTIATNMAGRGTDIILGGNPIFKTKQFIWNLVTTETENVQFEIIKKKIETEYENEKKQLKKDIENLPYSLENAKPELQTFYNSISKEIHIVWEKETEIVKKLGGLFVLGTERHENRRIDNQLRGRSGRQGDPGISQFFLSLDDNLLKIFGGTNFTSLIKNFMSDNETILESKLLTKSIENAQKKYESWNYDIRKNTFEYDEVLNSHRKILFKIREEILFNDTPKKYEFLCNEINFDTVFFEKKIENFELEENFGSYSSKIFQKLKKKETYNEIWRNTEKKNLTQNSKQLDEIKLSRNEKQKILEEIDENWTKHIERMSYIQETISWSSYGQLDPLTEYNLLAEQSFKEALKKISKFMIYSLWNS